METLKHETIGQQAKWKHVHDVHGNNNVSFKVGLAIVVDDNDVFQHMSLVK
jgi:hypothetical protein